MIALVHIIALSLAVLALLSRLLPTKLKPLISRREFSAAILLPIIAAFSPNYVMFALLVLAFISLIPASADERLRLFLFCLPLLPDMSEIIKAPAPINQLIRIDYNLLLTLGSIAALVSFRRASSRLSFQPWDVLLLCFFSALLLGGGQRINLNQHLANQP